MKTLEQRAKEYAHKYRRERQDLGGKEADAVYLGFIEGAKSERAELTMWRNPAEELPSDSMRVLVHVQLPNRASLVTGGWYGTHPSEQGWHIDISWEGLHVVGWRPLLDVSDL